jgi:mono/diheme cytochrome c family protein
MTMFSKPNPLRLAAALLVVGAVACGGSSGEASNQAQAGNGSDELTAFQLEHGIGPMTEVVEVGALDPAMAQVGEEAFAVKCASCHKIDERYVGPALGEISQQRSATFIMNMILNPKEMYERHPETKALLAEYLSFMPDQNVTPEEARAIVEYLRSVAPSDAE